MNSAQQLQWLTSYEVINSDESNLHVLRFLHMFNFNCEFTHMSHIWPDRKFNGELTGMCCKVIGVTTIELLTIL